MQTIWKYGLEVVEDRQEIEVPLNSEVLSVQTQAGNVCVWVLVPDTDVEEKEKIHFLTFGTGNPIENNIEKYNFLGTYQIMNGLYVFHVFYKYNRDIRIVYQTL